ncbi:MAG: 4Fe-4S dicluster domain-containing protein [Gemmatimonadales bacterium]
MPPMTSDALSRLAGEMSRRDFVRLLGASMALAGVTGCVREPSEPVFPYIHPPDDGAGTALHFATAMTLDGYATGLLVRSVDGRPVKIEGNTEHPASLGASSAQHQAALLQLYDPHRAGHRGGQRRPSDWTAAVARFVVPQLRQRGGATGTGVCLLLDPISSPVTITLIERLRDALPGLHVHFHQSVEAGSALQAHRAAFGEPLLATADLTRSEVVVALDADPLADGPWSLRYARDFGARRGSGQPVRLHVAQVAPSPTGTLAHHRVALAPSEIVNASLALAHNVAAIAGRGTLTMPVPPVSAETSAWVDAVAADLAAHRGSSVVLAGDRAPIAVHVAAAMINDLLDNVGTTVWYHESPVYEAGEDSHDPVRLAEMMAAGGVDTFVVAATNPVYTAPADLPLGLGLAQARNSLYLGEYPDETAEIAGTFLPQTHFLEAWDAVRARDGTVSSVQPLIAPIFGAHSVNELLAGMLGDGRSPRALIQALYPTGADVDVLRRGLVPGSQFTRRTPGLRADSLSLLAPAPVAEIELRFTTTALHDGRFAGNAWLQELPDPITSLTWDNALLLSPATAKRVGVESGDVVDARGTGGVIAAPVLVVPGHADGAASLALGYGRRGEGILDEVIGVDAAPLRSLGSPFVADAVRLVAVGARHTLALTQQHWTIDGRADDISNGSVVEPPPGALYHATPSESDGFAADQWAMTIDLDRCTGCSACVVACQAENNIPVVGKPGVIQSREMQWIRIHRYLDGAPQAGGIVAQPMLCQHCENAPCEYVCPVNATVHSDDGLNEMIYNRCVGTRFCSNNCPYKVRRFNWLNYHDAVTPVDELLYNPDVTVRARGVMEKCTFCVQRIRTAQAASQLAGNPTTGPVMTACQQACPTGAIVFGSLTNPADAIVRSFHDERAFTALASLNTRPRVHYLRRRAAGPEEAS